MRAWIEPHPVVVGREDHDLAAIDPAVDQPLTGGAGVGDDELQAAHRAGCHLLLRRQVTEHDGAARAGRCELDDVHVLVPGVVVEVEAHLVAVEPDRRVDVADGEDDDFQGPVHRDSLTRGSRMPGLVERRLQGLPVAREVWRRSSPRLPRSSPRPRPHRPPSGPAPIRFSTS